MTRQKKTAELGEQCGQGKAKGISANNHTSTNPAILDTAEHIKAIPVLKSDECRSKKERVLNHLAHYGSLNRFEASRQLYDSTLNSTISTLANMHGVVFDRHWEAVPNRAGSTTRVVRYSLANESRGTALKLLKHWRVKLWR